MFATTNDIALSAPARPWGRALVATVALWAGRSRQRRALAGLSMEALADIGLDPATAAAEAAKPFWAA